MTTCSYLARNDRAITGIDQKRPENDRKWSVNNWKQSGYDWKHPENHRSFTARFPAIFDRFPTDRRPLFSDPFHLYSGHLIQFPAIFGRFSVISVCFPTSSGHFATISAHFQSISGRFSTICIYKFWLKFSFINK